MLLRDCDESEGSNVSQCILKAFKNSEFIWKGIHLNLNCSIGIRMIDYTASSPQMVHAQADTACNLAKGEGEHRAFIQSR